MDQADWIWTGLTLTLGLKRKSIVTLTLWKDHLLTYEKKPINTKVMMNHLRSSRAFGHKSSYKRAIFWNFPRKWNLFMFVIPFKLRLDSWKFNLFLWKKNLKKFPDQLRSNISGCLGLTGSRIHFRSIQYWSRANMNTIFSIDPQIFGLWNLIQIENMQVNRWMFL